MRRMLLSDVVTVIGPASGDNLVWREFIWIVVKGRLDQQSLIFGPSR